MSDTPRPTIQTHHHDFPNDNQHRHSHVVEEGHPVPVNEAHPQPFYFLCVDCEPDRARRAKERSERAVAGEWS